MMMRRPGGTLRALRVVTAPEKTSYVQGETPSLKGAVIAADFGGYAVPLSLSSLTVTPNRALLPSDSYITVSATVGRITKSATISILVEALDADLDTNTWAKIAKAAAAGIASQLWPLGSVKKETINGEEKRFVIVGFNADILAPSDALYGNADYNGGSGKAAITFRSFDYFDLGVYNRSVPTKGGWDQSTMRLTHMQDALDACPFAMQSVIRTVVKYTAAGGSGTQMRNVAAVSMDRMFLASVKEIFGVQGGSTPGEAALCAQYAFYAGGSNYGTLAARQWLRSPWVSNFAEDEDRFALRINDEKTGTTFHPSTSGLGYFPMFCV